jgi:hypothetical protein
MFNFINEVDKNFNSWIVDNFKFNDQFSWVCVNWND